MGVQQSDGLNWDEDGKFTTGEYGDDGDGNDKWVLWIRAADGGVIPLGAIDDAAEVNPAASATVVALLKGLLSKNSITALGLLKAEDAAAASGDAGVMALAIRRDAPTSDAAAGDYHALHVDALGRLRIVGTFAEDVAHASGDYGNFILGVANTARAAFSANGDYTPIATGLAGETLIAPVPEANTSWALSNSDSAALEASRVIKASAGKLYKLRVTNTLGSVQYIQLFNAAAVPADTTVPNVVASVAAGGVLEMDFTQYGRMFSTGICVSNSSTPAAKTIGAADCLFSAQYL